MNSRTITSVFQTRKRRYQDPMGDAVRPKCKQITKIAVPSTSRSISKSPSPVARSTKTRQSVRDTPVRFLCSQSDSQPEISWNCNSPEFNKPVPRRRDLDSDSDNNDMLSLIHNTFNTTPLKKNEDKKKSLLALWMAPTEGDISRLPTGLQSKSMEHKTQPIKHHVGKELEQLISKVKREKEVRPHPVNALQRPAPGSDGTKSLKVIDSSTFTSSEAHGQNHEMERHVKTCTNLTSNLDNETKCAVEKLETKTETGATSFDAWSDDELFNDEDFIEQTQKLMAGHAGLSMSQLPTQRLVNTGDTTESDNDLQDSPTVDVSKPLPEVTAARSHFTILKNTEAVPVAGPSKLTTPLQRKSEQKNINLDEFWNCDDGIDEIMCTLGDSLNKEDSLDYIMNCDTQPYPATNQDSSLSSSFTTCLIAPTQVLDEHIDKLLEIRLHESMHQNPLKFYPLPTRGNSNTVTKVDSVMPESSYDANTNRPSLPSKTQLTQLENPRTSKIMSPETSGRCYTAEEIERKKHEALEKRRQKLEQKKLSARCQVMYSQIMPTNMR